MGDCSSQKKGSKYNFVDMHQAYQDLQYRYLQLNPKIGPGSDIDAGLLGHPEKYTIDLDQEEESLVALRSENIKVRDFIERTADVADQDQFEERLRREMPSYYQTLKRFEEWLGKDSQGMNLLDEVVMNTVSDISSAYYGADEGLSGLEISLRKNLSRVAGDIVGNFEGVDFYQNHSVVGVAIHNYHLLAVLPQLVLKRMKVGAEAYSDSTYAREYFESLGNKAGKITKELSASYDRANVNVERSLEVVGRNREYFSSFKESLGITETQVARLINAAVVKKEGRDGFDKKLFRGLFNAMELEKRGKVSDMKSPAFKSFFKMLCPSVTDESWERI